MLSRTKSFTKVSMEDLPEMENMESSQNAVWTGTVKWFDEKKGYGFITPADGGKDVFVHYSDIETSGFKTLHEGDQVQFAVTRSDRGLKAANVSRVA